MSDAAGTGDEAAEDDRADEGAELIGAELFGVPAVLDGEEPVIFPAREAWGEVAAALLDDGYEMCIDVTAVDYLSYPDRSVPAGPAPERFELVASFVDMGRRRRVRARIQVPADDPVVPSLYALYPGSDFMEREVFDMFGLGFDGHPDLSRILMPETWEGHPLRKDFAVGSIPVQFKGAPGPR